MSACGICGRPLPKMLGGNHLLAGPDECGRHQGYIGKIACLERGYERLRAALGAAEKALTAEWLWCGNCDFPASEPDSTDPAREWVCTCRVHPDGPDGEPQPGPGDLVRAALPPIRAALSPPAK